MQILSVSGSWHQFACRTHTAMLAHKQQLACNPLFRGAHCPAPMHKTAPDVRFARTALRRDQHHAVEIAHGAIALAKAARECSHVAGGAFQRSLPEGAQAAQAACMCSNATTQRRVALCSLHHDQKLQRGLITLAGPGCLCRTTRAPVRLYCTGCIGFQHSAGTDMVNTSQQRSQSCAA
jgi:hypothetical protein